MKTLNKILNNRDICIPVYSKEDLKEVSSRGKSGHSDNNDKKLVIYLGSANNEEFTLSYRSSNYNKFRAVSVQYQIDQLKEIEKLPFADQRFCATRDLYNWVFKGLTNLILCSEKLPNNEIHFVCNIINPDRIKHYCDMVTHYADECGIKLNVEYKLLIKDVVEPDSDDEIINNRLKEIRYTNELPNLI